MRLRSSVRSVLTAGVAVVGISLFLAVPANAAPASAGANGIHLQIIHFPKGARPNDQPILGSCSDPSAIGFLTDNQGESEEFCYSGHGEAPVDLVGVLTYSTSYQTGGNFTWNPGDGPAFACNYTNFFESQESVSMPNPNGLGSDVCDITLD